MPGGSDPVRRAGFSRWSLHRDLLQEAFDLGAQIGGGASRPLPRPPAPSRPSRAFRSRRPRPRRARRRSPWCRCAALVTFCEISPVAAFCCCTDAATAEVWWLISCMRSAMRRIASTAAPVEALHGGDLARDLLGRLARSAPRATSPPTATTAKPRPASPARAASMVALSASRLVCPATSWISLTTSPIFCAACASEPIWSLVAPASVDRDADEVAGLAELAADLVDRRRQLVRRPTPRSRHWPRLRSTSSPRPRRAARSCARTRTAWWRSTRIASRRCRSTVLSIASMRWRNAAIAASTVDAALLLGGQAVALLILPAALGDVLMGGDPAAVRHRPAGDGDEDRPPGRSRTSCTICPSLHLLHRIGDVVVGVPHERAGADAMLEQLAQQCAGLHEIGGRARTSRCSGHCTGSAASTRRTCRGLPTCC